MTDDDVDDTTATPTERELRRMVLLRRRAQRRPLNSQAVLALAMRVASPPPASPGAHAR
ncbi:hypothetical protein [Cellulomonas chengniuliangii]|uniref:hypothetical protein n=1 Tax=Cellulomonas chengniuliangii TaxID=2968084 RepID=UPI001D0E53F4|nr:hypothetical protein [Cellulomonas chengniuliangii]MCC2317064.1 hypothetical protein [Cellulomonas chengniuliangii]